MFLKQIEMHGFKSFPDRTKLTFEPGSTVIVGPNGSGKSNISDAMRWVLGEISSKTLRGTKMEDIIFGGSDSRKPMTFAEVSVTFDNSAGAGRIDVPYDEITVTRRYHRSGDSEYFINRSEVRLRDIYEMFLNTGIGRNGYSIIGQGRIADIISRRSDDRRDIFEDAAGIAKYRQRKNDAERNLDNTRQNVERIKDALTIMSGHVESLHRESIRAKRFVEYSEIKKQADVRLWLYDTEKLRTDISTAETEGKQAGMELAEVEENLESIRRRIERIDELTSENRREAAGLLDEIREKTKQNYETDTKIRLIKTRIEHAAANAEAEKAGIASLLAESEEEKKKSGSKRAEAKAIAAEIEKLTEEEAAAYAAAKKAGERAEHLDGAIAEAFDEISACRAELSDAEARLELIGKSDSEEENRGESAKRDIAEKEREISEKEAECVSCRETVAAYEKKITELSESLAKAREKISVLGERQKKTRAELADAEVRGNTLSGRIEALRRMEEHFEGYNNSVRHIMNAYRSGAVGSVTGGARAGEIYGPVSSLISVESRYVTAVEIALGASIQNIVVDNEETARAAIECLRRDGAGRATFYPLTSVKPSAATREMRTAAECRGYIGIASELVSCDGRFAPVISAMLGRTVVFDTLENATGAEKRCGYGVRAVTLDGQQIGRDGSFTGGSLRTGSGILTRADEISRMEKELVSLGRTREKLKREAERIASELESLEDSAGGDDSELRLTETLCAVEKTKLEADMAALEAERGLLEKQKEDLELSKDETEKRSAEMAALELKKKELEEKIAALEEFRNDSDAERGALLNEQDEKNAAGTALTVKISELRRDIESCNALADLASGNASNLAARAEERRVRIDELEKEDASLKEELDVCIEAFAEGEKGLGELNERRTDAEKSGIEYEKKTAELRRSETDFNGRRDRLIQEKLGRETSLATLRSQLDALSAKFWEEHGMTREEALGCNFPPLTKEERPAVLELQAEYRNKIRNVGHCDPASIEEYETEKAKYDSLTEQLSDLEKSEADLLKAIAGLEVEMKKVFSAAFDSINENFKRTFTELFGGGSAELLLSDPENVLESGIEIKAAPPGKIVKSLLQLSGGEQAIVAIALLFAILQVNPPPFCIFDEIEAALDEVNVDRFAQYVSRYSGDMQFIIITHRRGTMNAARRLYGVTMPESGISKVFALNVDEIAGRKGELWDGLS